MRLSEISRTIDIYNKRLYNENMESMPTVYLDMDGVLADFFGGIEKLYGVQHWKELTSDKTKDLKTEVIKKITGTNFFETLPKFNTADALVKLVQDFTGGIYSINTSPLRGDNKNSAYYKKVWIGRHLPKPQEIIVTGRKESYAMNKNNKPNILVDDRPINIQRWTGRGGYGILYQANRDSIDKVKAGLEAYKQKYMIAKDEAAGVGIVTKQNATKDVPVGGQYMNVKKLKLGKGKPKAYFETEQDPKVWTELRAKKLVFPMEFDSPESRAAYKERGLPYKHEISVITKDNMDEFRAKDPERLRQLKPIRVSDQEWIKFMNNWWNTERIKPEARNKVQQIKNAYKLLYKKDMVENFADGKGPGKPGDSQRHGIPKGATMAQLQKAAKAPGRKGQLARWQINMRRGRKKKS